MTRRTSRSGAALILIVVALAAVTLVTGLLLRQSLGNRKMLEHREHQFQALWAARAGLELAYEKCTRDGSYRGETIELLNTIPVKIEAKLNGDILEVSSEARYAAGPPVVGTVHARYRLMRTGDKVSLTPLPLPDESP